MRGYDRWRTTPPEDSFPPGVEDALGQVILMPEDGELPKDALARIEHVDAYGRATMIPEFGKVIDYEEHEDGDEDGMHYEVTLTVRSIQDGMSDEQITVGALEDFAIEDAGLRKLAHGLDLAFEARRKAAVDTNMAERALVLWARDRQTAAAD